MLAKLRLNVPGSPFMKTLAYVPNSLNLTALIPPAHHAEVENEAASLMNGVILTVCVPVITLELIMQPQRQIALPNVKLKFAVNFMDTKDRTTYVCF